MNSATSKDGYYSVFSSSDKTAYIVTTNGGMPLSLSKGHKELLEAIGVNWKSAECKNADFFYTGKGKSIRDFLDGYQ